MTVSPFSMAINEGRVRLHSHGPVRYITFPALDSHPEVTALTTLRNDHWSRSTKTADILTTAGFFLGHVLGIPFHNLIAGKQVHGTNVFSFPKSRSAAMPFSERRIVPSTDGFLTDVRRLALIVVTTDCLPIFLYDSKRSVIGLLHCGRAGTFDDMVGAGIHKMTEEYGVDAASCTAVIGPSVGPCCYDMDLWGANEHRLKELGVASVLNCRLCTKCNNDLFHSYRAERERAGRMVSGIALK